MELSGSLGPFRTPHSDGSRSPSRICEPKDSWPCTNGFSISTCTPPQSGFETEVQTNSASVKNTHPHDICPPSPSSSTSSDISTILAPSIEQIKPSSNSISNLDPPKTPLNKPSHRHTQSLGLLSPIPSFASFTAVFASYSSRSSPLSSPTPRSPSVSGVAPRPSPLRILQPFTALLLPTTPTPTLTPATATAQEFARPLPSSSLLLSTSPLYPETMSYIHQPRAQRPPSPSTSGSSNGAPRPVTPHRPPSRTEKLLRDALMRDEYDRNPMHIPPQYPYSSANVTSPGRPGHQRRHSHVPTTPASSSRYRQQDEERAEDLTRGAFLFRSAMVTTPRSPSPSPLEDQASLARRHSHGQGHHRNQRPHHHELPPSPYGAEYMMQSPTSASGSNSPRQDRTQSPLTRRSSVKSQSHYQHQQGRPASPSPASHSRTHTHAHHSPSYAPSVMPSHTNQHPHHHASPGLSRNKVPYPLALSPGPEVPHFHLPGEPMSMTPHEQMLRARLERVLNNGRVVTEEEERERRRRESREWMEREMGPEMLAESDTTDSDENVVRDENGGWAWRKKQMLPVATPPSSGSVSARSMSKEDMVIKRPQTPSHQRSRSHTEPAPPLPYTTSAHPSPRRNSTVPAARPHGRSGTTPPLVADHSPAPEEEDPEDPRLLTPPPTPPSQMAVYHQSALGYGKEYAPSPYKTSFDGRRGGSRLVPPLGLLRNDGRRGRSRGDQSYSSESSGEEEEEEEEDQRCRGEGCSRSSRSCSCSGSGSSHRSHSVEQHMHHGTGCVPAHPTSHSRRPQFNARRASARCRQMEGYVSFAAIEGLGPPPEAESELDDERKKAEGRKREGGVAEWMRWTKKRFLGGGEHPVQTQGHPDGVVV